MMKRILLIEDDIWLGQSFVRSLGKEFDVRLVETLQQAIDAINETLPDVIVADFMLQGQNSIELLHELSSYGDTAKIPVVLCSTLGEDLKAYETQLSHYGVSRVCDKADLSPDSLRRVVREVAALREQDS